MCSEGKIPLVGLECIFYRSSDRKPTEMEMHLIFIVPRILCTLSTFHTIERAQ